MRRRKPREGLGVTRRSGGSLGLLTGWGPETASGPLSENGTRFHFHQSLGQP